MSEIKQLSPSARGLLLAFLTTSGHEELEDLLARSGIQRLETYRKAKQQLVQAGYLTTVDGRVCIQFPPLQG